MLWNIFIISLAVSSLKVKTENLNNQQKPSVLIIGSSVPALTAALELTDRNISVTLLYSTNEIDNQISPTTTSVKNVIYRLPKTHSAIFEGSDYTKKLFSRFGNTFSILNKIDLLLNNNKILSISSNEYVMTLVFNAWKTGCISFKSVTEIHKVISAIKWYNPVSDKLMYSNITLEEFGKLIGAPSDFMSCFFKWALTDLGSQVETINAADAISRMQFYYVNTKNGLRSYHVRNPYTSKNNSKLLVDQIISQLKLKNTTFKPNYTLEAFYVDSATGKILGDINNRTVHYDYIILADNLEESRRILSTTKSYNSGDPKIFLPLKKALDSMNQYSNASNNLSMKLWFSHIDGETENPILEITNSPYPYSIQSIRQIHKLSGSGNNGTILELIVTGCTSTSNVNWYKIITELKNIFPEIGNYDLERYRYDPIDLGVSMDKKYGNNRLSTSSIIKFGIPNLILGGDWVDIGDSIANDLEKSIIIGTKAANDVVKYLTYKH